MNFDGRVCHVELGSDAPKRQLERVQEVLKRLTKISKEFLEDKTLDECWCLLKKQMHLKPIFLANDNVLDYNSMDEAKNYLKLGYCQGSIVMVASRARSNLQGLKIDENNCHEIPELDGNEAALLFLDNGQPNNAVGDGVLTHCVSRCYFSKGDGSFHYHPLALKVLGSQLAGEDPKEWVLRLREADVYNQRREQGNGVFSILRSSFDTLVDEDKLLFMDVVLFDTALFDTAHSDPAHLEGEYGLPLFGTLYILEWLRVVHGFSNVEAVKKRLDVLKKKSLLEELGDGRTRMGMHDLWREFAVMETKIGETRGGRWVYEVVRGKAEESSLSGGGWKDVRRIWVLKASCLSSFVVSSVKCLNFSNCSKLTVLKLVYVKVENPALDLSALKQLRSLEMVRDSWPDNEQFPKVSGIGLLTNLRVLIWLGIGVESASAVEEISCLTNLQVLQLKGVISPNLDLRQLRWLREVRVRSSSALESILGLSSIMTNLRILDLIHCTKLRSCPGVGDVVDLEVLLLYGCKSLEELPELQKLTKLSVLDIADCEALEAIPGFGSLVALQELCARNCRKLTELPDMSKLTKLKVLDLSGCFLLKCLPGLGNIVGLQDLNVGVQLVNDWLDLGNLTQLRTVRISGMHEIIRGPPERKELCWQADGDSDPPESHVLDLAVLESVSELYLDSVDHELSNLSKLTALTSLDLDGCNMERLPHMGKHMRLESLSIEDCERLRGWDGVGDRVGSSESETGVALDCDWTLPHLKELEWRNSGVVELPDLSHFPQLRELWLGHFATAPWTHGSNYAVRCLANHLHLELLSCSQSPIAELPDMSRFPRLEYLWLQDCDNLTSLTISGPLTALEGILLWRCRNLNALPSVDLFPRLNSFRIQKCGVQLNEQETEDLRARGFYRTDDTWESHWCRDPDFSTDEDTSGSEIDSNAGVQLALDESNDVAGPSSREVAPTSSDFIPYDESIIECAPAVSKRRGSSDTQPLIREEIRCFGGCGCWDMILCWFTSFCLADP